MKHDVFSCLSHLHPSCYHVSFAVVTSLLFGPNKQYGHCIRPLACVQVISPEGLGIGPDKSGLEPDCLLFEMAPFRTFTGHTEVRLEAEGIDCETVSASS